MRLGQQPAGGESVSDASAASYAGWYEERLLAVSTLAAVNQRGTAARFAATHSVRPTLSGLFTHTQRSRGGPVVATAATTAVSAAPLPGFVSLRQRCHAAAYALAGARGPSRRYVDYEAAYARTRPTRARVQCTDREMYITIIYYYHYVCTL